MRPWLNLNRCPRVELEYRIRVHSTVDSLRVSQGILGLHKEGGRTFQSGTSLLEATVETAAGNAMTMVLIVGEEHWKVHPIAT